MVFLVGAALADLPRLMALPAVGARDSFLFAFPCLVGAGASRAPRRLDVCCLGVSPLLVVIALRFADAFLKESDVV